MYMKYMYLVFFYSFDVTESTVHDCVTNVCRLILELEDRYVKWPSEEEQAIEMATFHARSGGYLIRCFFRLLGADFEF